MNASFGTDERKDYWIYDKFYIDRQVYEGPLHRRGWVFQERLLAPGVIHFAEHQVFWECFTTQRCEIFPLGLPYDIPIKNFDILWDQQELESALPLKMSWRAFALWNDLIEEYTKCQLTRQSDKLVAFSGLAKVFEKATGDEYVAGWWKSRLAEQLDWRVYHPVARSDTYRAPSWSWASIDGQVRPSGIEESHKMHVSILDIQVQSKNSDSFAHITDAYILLKGFVIEALCRSRNLSVQYELESEG